jgi:N-acetyl-gamma-glutamyl-phosphate reductase
MSHYKAFEHQHLEEINQSVNQLQSIIQMNCFCFPNRVICQRFLQHYTTVEEVWKIWLLNTRLYLDQPYVQVTTTNINMKQVLQTNKFISLMKGPDVVTSISIT